MAKLILATTGVARNNDTSKYVHVLKCVFKYLADRSSNRDAKSKYRQAISNLIDLTYEVIKANDKKFQMDSYQKNFRAYLYHVSILEKHSSNFLKLEDTSTKIAEAFANILFLAEDSFAKLGYPSSDYQRFKGAIETLVEDYKNLSLLQAAPVVAKLGLTFSM